MTKLKHPYIKPDLFKEVLEEAVADWVAAGWIEVQRKKSPKEAVKSAPKVETNTNLPATEGNSIEGELKND
jgi:hypothetical protein